MKKLVFALVSTLFAAVVGSAFAAEAAAVAAGASVGDGLMGLGAGLAIGVAAVGVGLAQAAIGSAGAGTLAERPEAFGQILIYLVIPETLIIFAFVIAFFLNGQIG
jgi:V/A-type H+-transporting ATPase subunit K